MAADSPGGKAGPAGYSLREIQSMLGLSRAVIGALVAAGFVTPGRGPRRELRFSFRDIVLLRTAHGLQAARIPPRRIVSALKRLRERLPAELPLSGLRITAVGNDIAVREGSGAWDATSGQGLIDFELRPETGTAGHVTLLNRDEGAGAGAGPVAAAAAEVDWYARALEHEAAGRRGDAEAAYRAAITQHPDWPDPVLNLGVLLADAGRPAEAAAAYADALQRLPDEPLLHFNLAVALEDLQQPEAALACYERCLQLAPGLADAHYNAGRLHEEAGRQRQAIRHYSAYRRLQKG